MLHNYVKLGVISIYIMENVVMSLPFQVVQKNQITKTHSLTRNIFVCVACDRKFITLFRTTEQETEQYAYRDYKTDVLKNSVLHV